jgi:dihydrofolate reductase
MRRLAASFFITLDGVVEAPQRWQGPYFDQELGAELGRAMAESDGFVLGRVTYEEWAGFWPTQPAENPMAAAMNRSRKYVASRTLDTAGWVNSSVLEGEAAEAVAALKREEGKDLQTAGSTTLVRSLLAAGLIDELRLMIHPVIVGRGRRLFDEGDEYGLTLVRSAAFGSGVISATYEVSPQTGPTTHR